MEIIRIRGAKEMEALLRQLPEKISEKIVLTALKDAAQPVLDEARNRAPVGKEAKGRVRLRSSRSGRIIFANAGKLRLSLKIMTVPKRLTQHSASVVVTVGKAFWGMFIEFGTKYITAKPFLRPAFESRRMEALDRLGKRLGNEIEKAATNLARGKR